MKLEEDILLVTFARELRDKEVGTDLLVAPAPDEEYQYFQFLGRECRIPGKATVEATGPCRIFALGSVNSTDKEACRCSGAASN